MFSKRRVKSMHLALFLKHQGPASMAQSMRVPLVIRRLLVRSLLGPATFVEVDHETFSLVVLPLQLIQEGQLSVSEGRMCTSTIGPLRVLNLPRKSVAR